MPSAAIDRPTLLAAAGSHAGLQRENNEDRCHCDPHRGIFMVIDGVGGQAAGEKAAETALTMIRARLERETGTALDRIREAITLANNEIFRLAANEPAWAGMACVLTVALVRDGRVTVGHVGDTRLYAFNHGKLAKVTHDHSPVGEREDRGELDEVEAMRHPRRNEIYRDVGSQHHEPVDGEFIETLEFPFEPDGALLLCTDGLTDMVASSRLSGIVEEYASDPSQVVEHLIEAANEAGGKDNVSVVFVAGRRFADSAVRRGFAPGAGTPSGSPGSRSLAGSVRGALASRPAILLYGVVAGLALAGALMIFSNVIPDRLLSASRPTAWTRTWSVGAQPGADFGTIQEALNRAQPGDVVEVQPGTYELPVVLPQGVRLQSVKPREAILQAPAGGIPPHTPALTLGAGSRAAGFKIDASGLATGVLAADGDAEMEDLEVVGATNAALVFGAGSRAVLRSSYLHDNPAMAVLVEAQGLPRLLHNVLTGNGRKTPAGGGRGPLAGSGAVAAAPAVLLQPGAAAVFFGNIVAGNGDDQIAGLAAERRADVVRDNVIGLAARAPAPARPPAAASARPAR